MGECECVCECVCMGEWESGSVCARARECRTMAQRYCKCHPLHLHQSMYRVPLQTARDLHSPVVGNTVAVDVEFFDTVVARQRVADGHGAGFVADVARLDVPSERARVRARARESESESEVALECERERARE